MQQSMQPPHKRVANTEEAAPRALVEPALQEVAAVAPAPLALQTQPTRAGNPQGRLPMGLGPGKVRARLQLAPEVGTQVATPADQATPLRSPTIQPVLVEVAVALTPVAPPIPSPAQDKVPVARVMAVAPGRVPAKV